MNEQIIVISQLPLVLFCFNSIYVTYNILLVSGTTASVFKKLFWLHSHLDEVLVGMDSFLSFEERYCEKIKEIIIL